MRGLPLQALCLLCAWLAGVCAAAQAPAAEQTFIPANDTRILYTGRIEDSHPERPVFTYPGVEIRTGFTGTFLQMVAKPQSGYFMVEIDGGRPFKVRFITPADSIATLATGLADEKTHQVVITHIGEGYDRLPEFHGLIVAPGHTLAQATPQPERCIEFIGNSITCGYGIEADDPKAPYLEETANYYHSYAAQTARSLRARAIVVARSGIGAYRNYNGPQTGDAVNMNTEYPYTLLYNNQHLWDFTRFTPQVVCIHLGTNDVSTVGADPTLLRQALLRLYRQVRTHYPKAHIVFLSGPMLQGQPLTTVKEALDTTAAQAHHLGDTLVHRLDFPPHDGSLGYGASYHPSLRQHTQMADTLTAYLKAILQW